MKKTWKKVLCVVLAVLLVAGVVSVLAACGGGGSTVILVWGPDDHESIYREYLAKFAEENADILGDYTFDYAGSGDSGAYDAMAIDPKSGAGVYTFANDQMANMRNLGALAVVSGENLEWSEANCSAASVEATRFADGRSYAYPLQADNGYYMYYNKSAFKGTSVWDANKDNVDGTKGDLKDGYTFRDLYTALGEKTGQTTYNAEVRKRTGVDSDGKPVYSEETEKKTVSVNWSNGVVTWPMGDSWYGSGVFFAVGGDYYVEYDREGKQTGAADCWFSWIDVEGNGSSIADYNFNTGLNAVQCFKNSITNASGRVDSHYLYSDGNKSPLNDYITYYTDFNDAQHWGQTPLAACVCGTWKAKELQRAWGEDYAATVLPTLENDAGDMFTMKNFAGYKHMGVNPQCSFVTDAPQDQQLERLNLLHKLAQYLCGPEISVARYESTGAGPANLKALENPKIAADAALLALNAQYQRECKYPGDASKTYHELSYADGTRKVVTKHGGDPVGNGLGCRTQDSVPANYWTPIQNFGNTLYQEYSKGKLDNFKSVPNTMRYLDDLQGQIQSAAQ